jgi:Scavenger mRNA decapping enzyme C-term binding
MNRIKQIAPVVSAFLIGLVIGGYLFSDTRPRSFMALNRCDGTCLQANELLGLIASVGLHKFTAIIPSVIKQTDKTIVIEHPSPHARIHYVVIPKKDLKNIGEFSDPDGSYLIDSFNVISEIIRERNVVDYQVITNGPGHQGVTYLHFHLISR